jgi:hypothetical protein
MTASTLLVDMSVLPVPSAPSTLLVVLVVVQDLVTVINVTGLEIGRLIPILCPTVEDPTPLDSSKPTSALLLLTDSLLPTVPTVRLMIPIDSFSHQS